MELAAALRCGNSAVGEPFEIADGSSSATGGLSAPGKPFETAAGSLSG